MLTTLGNAVTGTSTATDSDPKKLFNDSAVADIVGMIRAKYEDEGQRNFDIGRRAFEHAQWQKGNFSGTYTNGDFDSLMNRIRDDVRMYVPIKAESIQIAHWVRCHVLRELVGKEITPERAATLSMFEYKALVGKALHFTVADLEGDLNPCWLDMIKGVATERAAGTAVKREDFENRIVATESRAAAAKLAKLDPDKAAAKIASDKVKASAAAVAKTVKDITTAVDTGIASGAIKPEGALAILEGVAKHHGIPLVANAIGFDPLTASVSDCETMIAAMFGAGRLVELKAIVAKASKAVATMEKAAAKAASKAPAPAAMADAA